MTDVQVSPAGPAAATAIETPRLAREIIDGSMSPYCPGLTLAACPSPSADSLRQAIIARVNQGETKAHLLADLERSYGTAIRATPSATGFGLVGWAVPAVAFLVAAALVFRWLRRATASARA
jgi:cytochrome c-type biogenesis protein CcmH/NrfF